MPYSKMPPVASFAVTSEDVGEGERLALRHWSGALGVPGGEDVSPQLSWSGAPAGTRSFAVTMFDPDAPPPAGFWHWGVMDIPADVTELASGAGSPGVKLPGAAFSLRMDVGLAQYVGAAPPAGTGRHRYYTVVHALPVESVRELGVNEDSTLTAMHFLVREHTLGRATLVAWASADEG